MDSGRVSVTQVLSKEVTTSKWTKVDTKRDHMGKPGNTSSIVKVVRKA